MKNQIIHKTAVIKRLEFISMGDNIAIDPFFYMTTRGVFGNCIHIGSHVSVIGGIEATLTVGDYVAISTGCRLICRSDDFTKMGIAIPFIKGIQRNLYGSFIEIKNKAILGANVVILPDVIVSEGTVIGANSLVLSNSILDEYCIYAGTPAKKIGVRHD